MSGNFEEGPEGLGSSLMTTDYHPTIKSICMGCSMQCERGCAEFINGADK